MKLGITPAEQAYRAPGPLQTSVRSFGQYELRRQIGRGGMGVVYQAVQKRLNRTVALKMILDSHLASPLAIQRFLVEAETTARLDHPNIVPIYEFGDHEGQYFFSMKLIEGENLSDKIARAEFNVPQERGQNRAASRALQAKVAALMAAVARAVHYAHQHGVLHRDLKPSNILIDADGQPHLTDFGLAKVADQQQIVTATGAIIGTPAYMSPEQALGQKAGSAADIYSLGAILYQLLTGKVPFEAETPLEILRLLCDHDPPRPRTINRWINPELETICLKCMEKNPQHRYASAEAVAEDLERWLRQEPIKARRAGVVLRCKRWGSRNPKLATAVLFLIVSLAISLVLLGILYRSQEQKKQAIEGQRQTLQVLRADLIESLASLYGSTNRDEMVLITSEKLRLWMGRDRPAKTAGSMQPLELTFATYSHQSPKVMLDMMGPLLLDLEDYLDQHLARPLRIHYRIYSDYDIARQALGGGGIDFMRLGQSSYVKLKEEDPGVHLIAAQNGTVQGAIFTHRLSRITNLAGLKGQSFAFVDEVSTMGGYLAKLQLLQAGIQARDLKSYQYLISHGHVVEAVARQEFSAGAANASVVERAIANGLHLRVIHTFSEVDLGMPWVARSGLDAVFVQALKQGLLSMKDIRLLSKLGDGTSAFVHAQDRDFDPVRESKPKSRQFDVSAP
ncbi:MAG: serine/threonine-protein kinase [Verrucomicrobia subdivision 3 bacterium]|nr:serine/threonine-protein kinase [Limisphaerales bacterium]